MAKIPTIRERITTDGHFDSRPNENYIIVHHTDMITGEIDFYIEDSVTGERSEMDCLPNQLPVWKMFKKLNEIGGRAVFMERADTKERVRFEETPAYKYRFKNDKGKVQRNSP